MTVYTLPRKQPLQATTAPLAKPVKGSPEEGHYAIVKASAGIYQVVTKDGGVVQASFPSKEYCCEWITENQVEAA